MISLPTKLRKLTLCGRLQKLPEWIPELQNLVVLRLTHSNLTKDPMQATKKFATLVDPFYRLWSLWRFRFVFSRWRVSETKGDVRWILDGIEIYYYWQRSIALSEKASVRLNSPTWEYTDWHPTHREAWSSSYLAYAYWICAAHLYRVLNIYLMWWMQECLIFCIVFTRVCYFDISNPKLY